MKKIKVLPIGSCRIYRPFLKMVDGLLHDNTFDEIEVVYPRFGYFHSIKEITQVLNFITNGFEKKALNYIEYLFRKEPQHTTPKNTFNEKILSHLDFCIDFSEVDVVLIEISSLDYFFLEEAGLYLHWNPNFIKNVPYPDIYPNLLHLIQIGCMTNH